MMLWRVLVEFICLLNELILYSIIRYLFQKRPLVRELVAIVRQKHLSCYRACLEKKEENRRKKEKEDFEKL